MGDLKNNIAKLREYIRSIANGSISLNHVKGVVAEWDAEGDKEESTILDIREGYAFFWGQWPSNWFIAPMLINGIIYNCVEQWMMAEKARMCGDNSTLLKIMATPDPKEQKRLGRGVSPWNETEWNKIRYDVVLRGTIEKYRQNVKLKVMLLATGDARFVEASPYDKIWGIGMKADDPGVTKPENWKGSNLLGSAIDEARDVVKREP